MLQLSQLREFIPLPFFGVVLALQVFPFCDFIVPYLFHPNLINAQFGKFSAPEGFSGLMRNLVSTSLFKGFEVKRGGTLLSHL
jgi:hypothetical protein